MMISQDGVLDRGSVAVVVPAYNRAQFTPDEEISFRHLEHVLGRYDKFLAVPRSLEIERPGYQIQRFDDGYFGSAIANGKLMLSPAFYESFRKYRYILIYQLDALVFSDQLLEWCATDVDYIVAPWVQCSDSPFILMCIGSESFQGRPGTSEGYICQGSGSNISNGSMG